MKKAFILFILFSPILSFGQYQSGFLSELYFGRQPSARAEALGKSYNSIDGDLSTVFFNPAGTATLKGAEMNSSLALPYYALQESKYFFASAGVNINQYLTIGISRNHFTWGEKINYFNGSNSLGSYTPRHSTYSLNVSSQPIQNLLIGLNANHLRWNPNNKSANSTYLDFGIIKKLPISDEVKTKQIVNLGASISNLNFAETSFNTIQGEFQENLPVINRYGVSYQFHLNEKWLSDTLQTFRFLVQTDYQLLLNSEYHRGLHAGIELMFLEILSLRWGYYEENINDYNFPTINRDQLHDITYGFGIQVPLEKLSKLPLNISFDYISLPQTPLTKGSNNLDDFSTYTLRLNWLFKG